MTIRVPQDQPTITDGLLAAHAGDSVVVDCGIYYEREIQMKSGVTLRSVSGLPECVTIDASQHGRVLLFEDTSVGTVAEGITFTGGIRPANEIGGGILLVDSQATFRNCVIKENNSCGLWSRSSEVVFESTIISQNHAGSGGGIIGESSVLNLSQCKIEANEADDHGGGLLALVCEVQASDCDFLENVCYLEGGAIKVSSGTLQLENCRVQRNQNEFWNGGAIFASNSQCDLQSCQITDNVGGWQSDGAGAFFELGTANVADCEFARNDGSLGGGLSFEDADATVQRCIFRANRGAGAGCFVAGGSIHISETSFEENEATGSRGGGLYVRDVIGATLSDCSFRSNVASEGGAIRLFECDQTEITRCQFIGNLASSNGGGIDVRESSATLQQCTMTGNIANANAEIDEGFGGAIRCVSTFTDELVLQNCTLAGNEARDGGGIAVQGASARMEKSILAMNQGGAIFADSSSELAATCTDLYGNQPSNWPESLPLESEANKNLSADPLFCDSTFTSLSIRDNSLCIAARSPCGELIGAWEPACPASGIYLGTHSGELLVRGDGQEKLSEAHYDWAVGSTHQIEVPEQQERAGQVRYTFREWNDGGNISHSIQVQSTLDRFIANYDSLFFLQMDVDGSGSVNPQSGWREPFSSVTIQAIPDSGWVFAGWTGSGEGSYTGPIDSLSISMARPIRETAKFAPGAPLTVLTEPPGLTVSLNGIAHVAPFTILLQQFSTHLLSADSLQVVGEGHRKRFRAWSDGGAMTHPVTIQDQPLVLTATFATDFQLKIEAGPLGTVDPKDVWGVEHSQIEITADPADGSVFDQWVGTGWGSYTGENNPAIVTMNSPIFEQASFTFVGIPHGFNFTISSSPTDPYQQIDSPTGALRSIYLWITCAERGLARLEAGISGTLLPLAFIPSEGVFNAGSATEINLAVNECPTGDELARNLGHWLVIDQGGNICLGLNSQGVFGAEDCAPAFPGFWNAPRVHGFASDGSLPCIAGTTACSVDSIGPVSVQPLQTKNLVTRLSDPNPNPFTRTTQIGFSIAAAERARISIFDVQGRLIETLFEKFVEPGEHNVAWEGLSKEGHAVPSGIYFVHLETGRHSLTKKIILLRKQ